jgi:hypothetical protein
MQIQIELFRRLLGAQITRVEHQIKGELACAYFIRENKNGTRERRRRPQVTEGSNSKQGQRS